MVKGCADHQDHQFAAGAFGSGMFRGRAYGDPGDALRWRDVVHGRGLHRRRHPLGTQPHAAARAPTGWLARQPQANAAVRQGPLGHVWHPRFPRAVTRRTFAVINNDDRPEQAEDPAPPRNLRQCAPRHPEYYRRCHPRQRLTEWVT